MQYFMHGNCYRSQNLSSKCLLYPHQHFGEKKVYAKWVPYVLNNDRRAMRVLLATTHLQHWRNESIALLHHILIVEESWMHSFDPQVKWQNAEWRDQMSLRKKIAQHSEAALKVIHVMFFSQNGLVLDHPGPVGIMVNGQYYCSCLHAKWGPPFAVNNQNHLSMVSFCSRTMQHLITIMMCKIWCNIGAGMCWHILPTLQISPHVITGCLNMLKNILGVNKLNRKMISTLLSLPLYIVWARMNTELQLIIYHTERKSVLVISLSRGHTSKHSEACVIVVVLYCVITIKSH